MQWQKLKGIISFLSNIFHVMLAARSAEQQSAKEILDNVKVSHIAAPSSPFTTVFLLNHFLFAA